MRIRSIAVALCFCFVSISALSQQKNQPLLSPRLAALTASLASGAPQPLEEFWTEVKRKGTPLVESIPGDPNFSWVTFLWRATAETKNVVIVFQGPVLSDVGYFPHMQMLDLPGTDIWYRTYRLRNDARFSYRLSPNDSLEMLPLPSPERVTARMSTVIPDPLNLHQVQSAIMPGPQGTASSLVELPSAPTSEWLAKRPAIPKGELVQRSYTSALLKNERSVWIYTPADYDKSKAQYPLLVFLDGENQLPSPVTLDDLIAAKKIPPCVALYIGNAPNARGPELFHGEAFADALVSEILPWVELGYRLLHSPKNRLIGGRSLGGSAALFIALRHPEAFGNVIAQSGGLHFRHTPAESNMPMRPGQLFDEGFPESEWLVRQFAASPKLPLHIYVEAGLFEDIELRRTPPRYSIPSLLNATRHFRDVLQAKGYDFIYHEFNGTHEPLNWQVSLPNALIEMMGSDRVHTIHNMSSR